MPATSPCTIISKSFYEANADNYGTADGVCLGTGAYKFDSWDSGSQIVLTKNENWWKDISTLLWDKVVYVVIADNTARALAAQSGQVDYVHYLHAETLEIYDSAENLTVNNYEYTTSAFIAFNTQKAPFDDINVRKACAYALDKEAIAKSLGGRYAKVSKGVPFGPSMYGMDEEAWNNALDNDMEDYSFDIEKAKESLAQSTYPDGFTCEIYCLAGNTGLSEVVQYQLSLLGITVEIVEIDSSSMYEVGYGYKLDENGDRLYDILATGWLSDYLDPIGYLVPFWASSSIYPGGANRASYSNPEVDALIDQIYNEPDDAARAALEIEAFTIAAEDCPYVTLYYYDQSYALSNEYSYTENAGFFWNFRLYDFEKAE